MAAKRKKNSAVSYSNLLANPSQGQATKIEAPTETRSTSETRESSETAVQRAELAEALAAEPSHEAQPPLLASQSEPTHEPPPPVEKGATRAVAMTFEEQVLARLGVRGGVGIVATEPQPGRQDFLGFGKGVASRQPQWLRQIDPINPSSIFVIPPPAWWPGWITLPTQNNPSGLNPNP